MHPIEKDEKFPGPGTYELDNGPKGIPGFKIVKPGQTKVNERTKGNVPIAEERNGPWTTLLNTPHMSLRESEWEPVSVSMTTLTLESLLLISM